MSAALVAPRLPLARRATRPRYLTQDERLPDASLGMSIFPSALRWIAMLGRGETLLRLTFGHASADDSLAALRADDAWQPLLAGVARSDWNPWLAARLQAYAEGKADDFLDVQLDLSALTAFQRRVVKHCRRIPRGQTLSYGQLAALAGSPRAARAVGNVMAANQTPLVVPCHRVVAAGGLGHYSAAGGRRMKLRLLEAEASVEA